MKKLHLLLFAIFTTLSASLFAQDNLVEYLKRAKGFSTNDSCKIVVKQYYGLSESRYYFRIKSDKTYYYIDTIQVNCVEDIKIGKNKGLASEKYPGLKRGLWLGAVCVGIVLVPAAAGFTSLIFYATDAFPSWDFDTGFIVLNAPFLYVWYEVLEDAIRNVKLVKAYQTAKPYLCQ
jgi:hypothetical protein